jgi:hypothetical protein
LGFVTTWMVAAVTMGCGGEPEFAPQPGPPDGGVDAAPPPPLPDASAPDAAGPTTAQPCDAVMAGALSSMFEGRRKAEAPGMDLEGSPVCGVVPEGQDVKSQTFMLQPGFCYTFLGQALPNVTEVDMQLVLDTVAGGLPPAIAAMAGNPLLLQDTLSGQITSMGAKKDCYKWAFPAGGPVKLIVKARTGSGPIAAQVYKKKQP